MNHRVIISGCSGGGKSTLLAELGRRGFSVVEEPGRRIVKEELESGGCALPWLDEIAFTRRLIATALADYAATAAPEHFQDKWEPVFRPEMRSDNEHFQDKREPVFGPEMQPDKAQDGWVFFDRGLVDAAVHLQHLTGEPVLQPLAQSHRYHPRVFLTPPWPEIYVTDPERRHGFDAALAEYERLLEAYPSLGYEVFVLPKVSVAERARFVLKSLAEGKQPLFRGNRSSAGSRLRMSARGKTSCENPSGK